MKPVVKIVGGDEYGPLLEWSTHWAELVGKTLCLEDTHPPTGDASGKDSVDAACVFALTERVPEVGQRVIVVSENWCAPKILEYVAFPHPRLLDRETGRWYWYPERMQWQALSATVIAAIASLTKTADGEIQS